MSSSEVWSFPVGSSLLLVCRYSVTLACTLLLTDLLPMWIALYLYFIEFFQNIQTSISLGTKHCIHSLVSSRAICAHASASAKA